MLALLSLCLSLSALAVEPDAADHVVFTFGWRPGMKADVVQEQVRTNNGVTQRSHRFDASLDVVRAGGGDLELRWKQTPTPAGDATPDPIMDRIMAAFGAALPRERIHADGTYGGLSDPEAFQRGVDEVLLDVEGMVAEHVVADPQMKAMLDGARASMAVAFTPEAIAASNEGSWNENVGFWLGGDLEIGEEYELDLQSPSPLGPTVGQHYRFTVEARTPCSDAARAPQCVRAVIRVDNDPASTRELTLRVMAPMLQAMGLGLSAVTSATITTTRTVLIEPATLRPWRTVAEESTSMTLDVGGPDGPSTLVRGTTKTQTWRWR